MRASHLGPCRLLGVLLTVLFGLWSATAHAQARKIHIERFGFDRLPDLRVYLTFVEADGTPITGKTKSDFKLLLDSADQGAASSATTFDQLTVKEPVYVVAVVQVSPAMEDVLVEVKKGLRELAQGLGKLPGSKISLLGYGTDTKRIAEHSTPSEFEGAINKLAVDPETTDTHLLDALRIAIDLLGSQPPDRRKLVVLFSDGIDATNEKKAFVEVGRKAEQAGVVIDTIGYAPFEPGKMRMMIELSKNSYGTERACKAQGEITARFGALVDELQKQYVLTFPLSIQGDNKEHGFQVTYEAGNKPEFSNTVNRIVPTGPAAPPPPTQEKKSRWWLWALLVAGLCGAGATIYYIFFRKPAPPVVAAPTPALQAPMPTPGRANKTIAIDNAGDVAMGWVMGLTGSYKDKTFKLKARNVIGTAPDCDIIIEDGYMSSHHAEIRQVPSSEGGGFKLMDLGSRNGMVVNDKTVREHFLVDNDAFRLGRTEFKFKAIV